MPFQRLAVCSACRATLPSSTCDAHPSAATIPIDDQLVLALSVEAAPKRDRFFDGLFDRNSWAGFQRPSGRSEWAVVVVAAPLLFIWLLVSTARDELVELARALGLARRPDPVRQWTTVQAERFRIDGAKRSTTTQFRGVVRGRGRVARELIAVHWTRDHNVILRDAETEGFSVVDDDGREVIVPKGPIVFDGSSPKNADNTDLWLRELATLGVPLHAQLGATPFAPLVLLTSLHEGMNVVVHNLLAVPDQRRGEHTAFAGVPYVGVRGSAKERTSSQ